MCLFMFVPVMASGPHPTAVGSMDMLNIMFIMKSTLLDIDVISKSLQVCGISVRETAVSDRFFPRSNNLLQSASESDHHHQHDAGQHIKNLMPAQALFSAIFKIPKTNVLQATFERVS